MAMVAVSVSDPLLAPRRREADIEIHRFGDVVKVQTMADGLFIQLALSASDALAVAVRVIDAARAVQAE
jgi:hypothetical protein